MTDTTKTQNELLEEFKQLFESEDLLTQSKSLNLLLKEFDDSINSRREHEKSKWSEEGKEDSEFTFEHNKEEQAFIELKDQYIEKKKVLVEDKKREIEQQRILRKKIIADLKELIGQENHIGPAFQGLKEIRERWNSLPEYPDKEFRELQKEYSHQLELFYYNINIYKSLKDYDLKKNYDLKKSLAEKVSKLQEGNSIKGMKEAIGIYIKEWDEIGPTFKEKWEEVRDEFWEATRNVFKKINEHYKDIKEVQVKNFELKTELCEKVESLAKEKIESHKEWKKRSDEIEAIKEEWKKIGFATKKHNDKVWQRFRDALNTLYHQKNDFYKANRKVQQEAEQLKQKLIQKADAIKESTDWQKTTDAFIQLQKEWKNIGSASPKWEQKLWEQFRAACDHFFNAKKAHFGSRKDRMKESLVAKQNLVKELEKIKPGDAKLKPEVLNDFVSRWNELGPTEQNKELNSSYNKLLDERYKSIGLDSKEVHEQKFKAKIEGIKKTDQPDRRLQKEKQFIRDKIRKLENEINQYENNLGFFGHNTENNPLVLEVEKKIEEAKKERDTLKQQLRLI